jgi:hypothetical protein
MRWSAARTARLGHADEYDDSPRIARARAAAIQRATPMMPTTSRRAALQDLLVDIGYGIGQYARRARDLGAADSESVGLASGAMFTTLTNVNLNATRGRLRTSTAWASRRPGIDEEQGSQVHDGESRSV